jgi:hypothetical protein
MTNQAMAPSKKAKGKDKKKTIVYTITAQNRIKNSPFFVEGTDMVFDLVDQFPLPTMTSTFDKDGNPKNIRFIQGCTTIDVEEQIKLGYPMLRNPSDTERRLLTFFGGFLSVPEGYTTLKDYVDMAPWFEDKEGPRPPDSRVLYEIYDQDQVDEDNLTMEAMVLEAKNAVMGGSRDLIISLMRLNRPSQVIDPNINIRQAKLEMLRVAELNPDFVLKGIKSAQNDLTVIVSKAVDYGILNLDTTGKIKMKNRSGKDEVVTSIPDNGSRNQKMERTCAWFEGEGKTILAEVRTRVKEYEVRNGLDDDEDETGTAPTTTTTTTNLDNNKLK